MADGKLEQWEDDIALTVARVWSSRSPPRIFITEDAKQDALIHWWKLKTRRRWNEKPREEQEPLLRRVVARFLSRENRRMFAKKRRAMFDTAELTDLVPAVPGVKRDEALWALIRKAAPDLTSRQLEICELLMLEPRLYGAKTNVARKIGISLNALNKQIPRIRKVLARYGLGDRKIW